MKMSGVLGRFTAGILALGLIGAVTLMSPEPALAGHGGGGGGGFHGGGWGGGWGDRGDLPMDYFFGDDYGYYNFAPRRSYYSSSRHVNWCKARYRTYNARTDTFNGKGGKKYRCNSPYDGR